MIQSKKPPGSPGGFFRVGDVGKARRPASLASGVAAAGDARMPDAILCYQMRDDTDAAGCASVLGAEGRRPDRRCGADR